MTTLLTIDRDPTASIACDMRDASDTPEERLAEYVQLFARALTGRWRDERSVTYVFAAKPGVAEWATDLATREAACCPFLGHQLTLANGEIKWTVTAGDDPTAQAGLDEIFEAPTYVDRGPQSMVVRLEDRGFIFVENDTAEVSPFGGSELPVDTSSEH